METDKLTKTNASACGRRLGGASINVTQSNKTPSLEGSVKNQYLCMERLHIHVQLGPQFDLLNWFYWNLWWQQYSFWSGVHHESFSQHWNGASGMRIPGMGTGLSPPTAMPTPNIGMNSFTPPQNTLGVQIRIVSGTRTACFQYYYLEIFSLIINFFMKS